jgi:shikimate dehydrogenase
LNFYLLGYPVGHSVSPAMQNAAFREEGLPHKYSSLEVRPNKLAEIMKTRIRVADFGGASVTIPNKIEIIKYLDELAQTAQTAGAVNTLEYREGVLTGHNTDAVGGIRALTEVYGNLSKAKVVLIGAGGAANALATELAPKVKKLMILNRSIEKAQRLSERLGDNTEYDSILNQTCIEYSDIVINATPLGMSPKINESPVIPKYLHPNLLVYDIIYNPLKTKLMSDAEKIGAKILGGLWMLVYQGLEAFKIWTGIEPRAQTMYDAALGALEAMRH